MHRYARTSILAPDLTTDREFAAMTRTSIRTVFLAAALACLTVFPARADDDARQKLFIELYEVMGYDTILAQITDAVGNATETALRQKHPGIDRKAVDIVREVVEESFAGLKPDLVRFTGTFMVSNFTENEIRDLIAFYKTPTGRKSLTLVPKMTQELSVWIAPTMERVQAEMAEKLRKRLKKEGFDL